MKFPNAYEGVKKLFQAEILAIITLVFVLITLLGAGVVVEGDAMGSEGAVLAGIGIFGIFGICAAVLAIVVTVMQILALRQAGKDEPSFQIALYVVIALLVVSVILPFVPGEGFLSDLLTAASDILELLVTLCVISGIILLSEKCANPDMGQQGHKLFNIISAGIILSTVSDVVYRFFEMGGVVLGVIAVLIQLAVYILYLGYLKKAQKMLAE